MNVVTVSINEVKPIEKNVRKHPSKQIGELARSYEMFGQYRPLVVTYEGEILVGNGLYEAMLGAGAESVDVVRLPENASDEYKKKLMLADNKIFELGSNDMNNIDEILMNIEDFEIPGFDEDVLKELYSDLEEFEEEVTATMGVVSPERKQQIDSVSQKRVENPPEEVSAELTKEVVIPKEENKEERTGNYVTCPHCGCKIWL